MMFQAKRPEDFCKLSNPFYLAVVTNTYRPSLKEKWFLRGPMGKNRIEALMKVMAKSASLDTTKRITNTSVRKTLVQKMTENNVPDTLQVYVTGHKNTASLNNYRTISNNQKYAISNILSKPVPATAFMTREIELDNITLKQER
ncbi:hypothetical protein FSP39_011163 [Pinctada imbricata]|uniref:Tyr recombinase domain-containing protein n=1 Tax=Pinctada imbricata TaxID=66713 RepID=A0AA88YJJ1_PINIB|nr:hypothetical protein FSP39_011163 [Pinctada imbricata]